MPEQGSAQKLMGTHKKDRSFQLKGSPIGEMRNNLNIKTNNDGNRLKPIE